MWLIFMVSGESQSIVERRCEQIAFDTAREKEQRLSTFEHGEEFRRTTICSA